MNCWQPKHRHLKSVVGRGFAQTLPTSWIAHPARVVLLPAVLLTVSGTLHIRRAYVIYYCTAFCPVRINTLEYLNTSLANLGIFFIE